MTRKTILVGIGAALVFGTWAFGFNAYFSNAAGQKIGTVWEGQQVYIAIKDPEKGTCGIDEFTADLVIFDFKTGAYVEKPGAVFRELGGIGSGLYFWVSGPKSNSKVSVQVGSRHDYTTITGQTHGLGKISPGGFKWEEGAWEYVDENVLNDTLLPDGKTAVTVDVENLPQDRQTARVSFEGFDPGPGSVEPTAIAGRFENNDTLVLIVADEMDERNIDQDQVKIVDTVGELTVVPSRIDYGCGPSCENIVVTIDDKDENLNCNEIEYVPFFVIINPGSWNPSPPAPVTNFCNLMLYGGDTGTGDGTAYNEPIRWYNIYEPERYIDYGKARLGPQPSAEEATLIFSDLVGPVGGQGEVKVSVAKMPDGGLASLVVGSESSSGAGDYLGLQYDPTQFQVTDVQGLNGFMILAWGTFDPGSGLREVRFVAVNPGEGAVEGDVALIVGNRLGGADPNFAVDKSNLLLMKANGALIGEYNVATGQALPHLLKAVFFAAETSVDSGVFTFDFGNLEDFTQALGFAAADRLPAGTTFAFYYIDPNDFDDMDLATIEVGNRPHSQTFLTDANGIPASEVKIGTGWGGLYVRVYDADADVEACCQDKVVVHICDPHNEDDSEYYVIDEISNNSGIFFSQSGIPLLPVWDAVSGYQLVFDDWRIESFNEDTIFVRYNSVNYYQEELNALGDGDPGTGFPPAINEDAARNQVWDVSFAKVKAYDTQVFDGTTHHMRFLDGQYQPVDSIPISGSLYLEVTDLDQNEHPALRELIFGGWNKDAASGEQGDATEDRSVYTGTPLSGTATSQDAGEDSAPIWWADGYDTTAADDSDRMTPQGAVTAPEDVFLGAIGPDEDNLNLSISQIPETVKVFMWNAQRGSWERMDLRETAVGSGIFRSTTCALVADARNPGDGNLASKPGDTIMAFYQDPSNHSDVSIISLKVNEGGAGGITPPTVALSVAFDKANYNRGDTVTITVTDEQYAGAMEIVGTNVLVLKDAADTVLMNWNKLEAFDTGKFRVSYVLPATVTGTITALYTDPLIASRTAQAQATVAAPVLASVSDVKPVPEVFSTSTAFTVYAQPAGAVPNKVTVNVYDLTGRNVATLTGTNTTTVSWNGGTLRNGAYIYVAVVEGAGKIFEPFKGFVYIKR